MRSKCKARRLTKESDNNQDISGHVTDSDQSDEEFSQKLFIAEDPETSVENDATGTLQSLWEPSNSSSTTTTGNQSCSTVTGHQGGNGDVQMSGMLKSALTNKLSPIGQEKLTMVLKGEGTKPPIENGKANNSKDKAYVTRTDIAEVDFVMKTVDGKFGVWTNVKLEAGKTIGPLKVTKKDTGAKSASFTSDIETLMKFIQNTDNTEISNVMAVSLQNQLYYRAIREIQAGEEMLLYAKDKLYQDKDGGLFSQKSEDGETIPCSECGEIFKNRISLQRHQLYSCNNSYQDYNVHGQEEDFKSDDPRSCPEDVPETAEEGEFKCEECPRNFALKSNLARHQIVHESGRQYCCEHCDRHFTDPSNLQRHIRSQHHGARCHACTECGKTFATSSGLKQHQHIHSSVKPFQCEVCLKAYTQFSNLCRHKRMHADCRQQIKCNDCGQAFSTITSLSKHKRFCEGALRNGMRLGNYGSDSKLSPSAGFPTGNQTPAFSPAMMMGLYGARAPYPFYHPTLASLPMFSSGHPLAALTSLSPSSTWSQGQTLTPDKQDLSPAGKYEKRVHDGSDGGSEVLSGSDLDNIPSDSESEKSSGHTNRPSSTGTMARPGSSQSGSSNIARPTPYKPQPSISPIEVMSPRPSPLQSSPSPLNLPTAFTKVGEGERPFDLSKPDKQDHVTPKTSPVIKEESSTGEQPLDLSRTKEVTPPEAPRKTHIFGDQIKTPALPETPSKRLHYAYPQFPSQLIMEQALRMAESKEKSPESNNFMHYQRFPFSSPPQYPVGVNPFGFVSRESPKSMTSLSSISPQTKSFPDFSHASPQYSTPNKLKDRYSCKFCGKIFPRSANLTRHLRTHTGEQPYKCKYCERSFSISSNLQRHVRNIHNKEKPFRCPLCDRCFGQQTNLDRHLKKHETDGLNVVDSPENMDDREPELEDKDESYFSEIRNFIGKATNNLNAGDINQNSLSIMEMKQKIALLHDSRLRVPVVEKMEVEEEMEEEIDPVSDDIDERSAVSGHPEMDLADKDNNMGALQIVQTPSVAEGLVKADVTSNQGPLALCMKSGHDAERGQSPVMCS